MKTIIATMTQATVAGFLFSLLFFQETRSYDDCVDLIPTDLKKHIQKKKIQVKAVRSKNRCVLVYDFKG